MVNRQLRGAGFVRVMDAAYITLQGRLAHGKYPRYWAIRASIY